MPSRKKTVSKRRVSPLIYSDTQKSADQLYCGRFFVPDAFVSFRVGKKWIAVLNQLEYGRALKESSFDRVLPLEEWMQTARELTGKRAVGIPQVIHALAKQYGIDAFQIASDFPAGVAFGLMDLGYDLEAMTGTLFPQREMKSEEEIKLVKQGNRCSAAGIRAAEQALKRATIKKGRLVLDGKPLTSERLQETIEIACLQMGAISMDTIAAGGDQACDPHCRGSGPLMANELIIVDVFPRVSKTGYHGDMTRTFLKGKASDAQRNLVATVAKAQKLAIKSVKSGVNGKSIHGVVLDTFSKAGYETKRDENGAEGFFHGTGHGLGLEVHEFPRVSAVSNILKANSVITIEPGLYYPGLGGCRIEDVLAVRKDGSEKLSSFHYKWLIA